jgi:hypothetical protein
MELGMLYILLGGFDQNECPTICPWSVVTFVTSQAKSLASCPDIIFCLCAATIGARGTVFADVPAIVHTEGV